VLSRKRVFISYSHKDNRFNFVSRLGYALDFFADTFWDVKLNMGAWEQQLFDEIELCDIFVVVMSKGQQNSEICQKELAAAQKHNKQIIPIQLFDNQPNPEFNDLQWAVFTQSFDEGFRKLTHLIYGTRYSPWEVYHQLDDDKLLDALDSGLIPALIAKEIADWVLVNRLWSSLFAKVSDDLKRYYVNLDARNSQDLYRAVKYFEQQAINHQDFVGHEAVQRLIREFEILIQELSEITDSDNIKAGKCAKRIIAAVENYMRDQYTGLSTVHEFMTQIQSGKYQFDVTSRLRELILLYARRSRHLY